MWFERIIKNDKEIAFQWNVVSCFWKVIIYIYKYIYKVLILKWTKKFAFANTCSIYKL